MDFQTNPGADDLQQALSCLRGDLAALDRLRDRLDGPLRGILQARGASPTEAEDTLADLWGDCVANEGERPALLEKYTGKCPLQSWLATVATHRWYDMKRRQACGLRIMQAGADASAEKAPYDDRPEKAAAESAIVDLLRDSLKASFASCGARNMFMLRLVFLHGITQREIGRMLGWTETKVSRALSQAMRQIETGTLREIKKRDPWLALTWQDFLDLCQTQQIGFL